jgi:hypothetical protein
MMAIGLELCPAPQFEITKVMKVLAPILMNGKGTSLGRKAMRRVPVSRWQSAT